MSLYLYGRHPYGRMNNASPSLFRDDLCNFRDWLNAETLYSSLDFENDPYYGREIQIGGQNRQKTSPQKGLMSFNMGGCKPENIKVEIKDGMLHVESKEEHDGGLRYIRFERTIPKSVDPNALKATLLPNGLLHFKVDETSFDLPITHEKKN